MQGQRDFGGALIGPGGNQHKRILFTSHLLLLSLEPHHNRFADLIGSAGAIRKALDLIRQTLSEAYPTTSTSFLEPDDERFEAWTGAWLDERFADPLEPTDQLDSSRRPALAAWRARPSAVNSSFPPAPSQPRSPSPPQHSPPAFPQFPSALASSVTRSKPPPNRILYNFRISFPFPKVAGVICGVSGSTRDRIVDLCGLVSFRFAETTSLYVIGILSGSEGGIRQAVALIERTVYEETAGSWNEWERRHLRMREWVTCRPSYLRDEEGVWLDERFSDPPEGEEAPRPLPPLPFLPDSSRHGIDHADRNLLSVAEAAPAPHPPATSARPALPMPCDPPSRSSRATSLDSRLGEAWGAKRRSDSPQRSFGRSRAQGADEYDAREEESTSREKVRDWSRAIGASGDEVMDEGCRKIEEQDEEEGKVFKREILLPPSAASRFLSPSSTIEFIEETSDCTLFVCASNAGSVLVVEASREENLSSAVLDVERIVAQVEVQSSIGIARKPPAASSLAAALSEQPQPRKRRRSSPRELDALQSDSSRGRSMKRRASENSGGKGYEEKLRKLPRSEEQVGGRRRRDEGKGDDALHQPRHLSPSDVLPSTRLDASYPSTYPSDLDPSPTLYRHRLPEHVPQPQPYPREQRAQPVFSPSPDLQPSPVLPQEATASASRRSSGTRWASAFGAQGEYRPLQSEERLEDEMERERRWGSAAVARY
ncbi:hypothetical protein JCM10213_002656 [Rhodosporidiobolus nylandii]